MSASLAESIDLHEVEPKRILWMDSLARKHLGISMSMKILRMACDTHRRVCARVGSQTDATVQPVRWEPPAQRVKLDLIRYRAK